MPDPKFEALRVWLEEQLRAASQLQQPASRGGPPYEVENPLEVAGMVKAYARTLVQLRAIVAK